ncbi:hypothetical protein, partial [Isoptericola sp. QY 916]|nr:hypothetical protein [Isoptericola sp. QY 916]
MRPNPSRRLRASTLAAGLVAAALALPGAGVAPATAAPETPDPVATAAADRFPGFPGWPEGAPAE